jgi:ATP-binding dynein motor region
VIAVCAQIFVLRVQTTLVNFCVTEKGLEDQLLALVVEHERPDLQEQAQALVRQLGEFTITLVGLEDNLLTRLANAQGDILEDIELIENLEETKRTAVRHCLLACLLRVALQLAAVTPLHAFGVVCAPLYCDTDYATPWLVAATCACRHTSMLLPLHAFALLP